MGRSLLSRVVAAMVALSAAIAVSVVAQAGALAADAAGSVVRTENVTATLVPSVAQAAPGDTISVLLHQRIRPGWHTYWRNPGDSGQETTIAWSLPDGATASPIRWAAPERIDIGGIINYGYSDEVGLISEIAVPASWPPGTDLRIRADANWLVCEEICIPESGSFALDIPTGGVTIANAEAGGLLGAAERALPAPSPWRTAFTRDDDTIILEVTAPDLDIDRVTDVYFFPHEWGVIDHSAAQSLRYDGETLRVTMRRGERQAAGTLSGVLSLREALAGTDARLALAIDASSSNAAADGSAVSGGAGGSGTATASSGGSTGSTIGAGLSLPLILLLAFAGGVLLNIMPCVFPVLAMKALSLTKTAGGTRGVRLWSGLSYTAGILASFAALGGAFLVLKSGGAAMGWGFQLQDPIVVALLSYILFLVGLNLLGVFEIAGAWMGLGQGLAGRSGAAGSFFTGVLAAVVAAPCTAPFMATALGFAFTQTAPVAMGSILALGAGLAAPYLLLAASPAVARLLPKPGPWMVVFRQALAFPMFASAAWLIWVLAQQTDPDAILVTLLGMIALALAAWLFGQRNASPRLRRIGRVVAAVSVAGAIWLTTTIEQPAMPTAAIARDGVSERFSQARLDTLRADGRPVLVNMTAAWCITCKVNERVALSSDAFFDALRRTETAYLIGDWTRQDAEITAVLRRHEHAGVPLYALYYPDDRPPLVLPQILTESIIVDALDGI